MSTVDIESFSSERVDATVQHVVQTLSDPTMRARAEYFLGRVNNIDGQMAERSWPVAPGISSEGELVGVQYHTGRTFSLLLGSLASEDGRLIRAELDPSAGLYPWDKTDLDDLEVLQNEADLHIAAANIPGRGPTAELATALNGRDVDIYRRAYQTRGRQRFGRLRAPIGRIGALPLMHVAAMFRIAEGATE